MRLTNKINGSRINKTETFPSAGFILDVFLKKMSYAIFNARGDVSAIKNNNFELSIVIDSNNIMQYDIKIINNP